MVDAARDGINVATVTPWLTATVAGFTAPFTARGIAGGHSNLTFHLTDAKGKEYVLRRPPLSHTLASAHDMGREHRIIYALREHQVKEFVNKLIPGGEVIDVATLLARGDEASLREALKLEPTNEDVVLALAALLLQKNEVTDALEILQKVPQTLKIAALVERAKAMFVPDDNFAMQLDALLPLVKADEEARRQFLQILETMGPGDPRTGTYRRKMTGMLFA
ncbi:MAG: tetratricopeptide repeat protein [Actinomycetota bacterium]